MIVLLFLVADDWTKMLDGLRSASTLHQRGSDAAEESGRGRGKGRARSPSPVASLSSSSEEEVPSMHDFGNEEVEVE